LAVQLEIFKWLYLFLMSAVLFLFFCLILDSFCYLVGGGWQPLLGHWPIFSGSISLLYFGSFWKVACLLLGLVGTARIMLGKRVPMLIQMVFSEESGVDHPDHTGPPSENKSNDPE